MASEKRTATAATADRNINEVNLKEQFNELVEFYARMEENLVELRFKMEKAHLDLGLSIDLAMNEKMKHFEATKIADNDVA
jgi:hypothetical protein